MNWVARERGQREVNGYPRTREGMGAERAPETGLYPRGFGCRAERARQGDFRPKPITTTSHNKNTPSIILTIATLSRAA